MGARGPKPGTVKRPDGAGRKKGTPNKATAEIKALAQAHGATAIKTLATIMTNGDSDTAKIAAARELMDRGYGKATQPLAAEGGGGMWMAGWLSPDE